MSEIIKLTLNELVNGIKKKKFSSHEVTKDFVNRCIKFVQRVLKQLLEVKY